ncbi:AimR family lysis-lysogeny pheromone receptor [Bacillus cereus]|uniref:AimR family lysis-lysogeny pheromone receptor n=1 Tax=Bacillus cereus group TaxID=86661 RepID=UPI0010220576|nr:AimR family lysis-lysogeny pheromone receptor [Bacillus albus]MCU5570653.1 AimR family lysis-lysogeny pheromone receptor [Bacillus cereus]
MQTLLEIKRDKKISSRELAKSIGSSKTTIDNGLRGKTDEFKFEVFLKLVHSLCDSSSEQRELIHRYILACKTPLNIRKALCYCHAMGEYELLNEIIQKHSDKKEIKKYIDVYKIQNKRNQNIARGKSLLDEIEEQDFSSDTDCQVCLKVLNMEAMYDIQNYNAIIPIAERTKILLDELNSGYIKSCLEMKYKERLAYIYLLKNDLKKCRDVCMEIINSEMDITIIKATAWCCLGESYTFEDPLKSAKYIKKAIALCEECEVPKKVQKFRAFHTTLAHLYIENGMSLDEIRFDLIHISEKAYFECMHGDYNKGIKLYEQMKIEFKEFSAFQQYSYSKVNNDIIGLKKALESFELMGNIFYAQYVKKELLKEEVTVHE